MVLGMQLLMHVALASVLQLALASLLCVLASVLRLLPE